MVAPARGLTPIDLGAVRQALSAGRRPKVVFTESAGQIAGQVGQVVGLDDPATSDEFIVVRFGKDELPFAAHDLAVPARNGRSSPKPAPEPPPFTTPAPRRPAPATSGQRSRATKEDVASGGAGPRERSERQEQSPSERRRGPEKRRLPSSLVLTLTYADRAWSVTATVGSRTVAKPQPVRPADALRMVALVNLPGLHDAVESIIAAERTEAETRAQRLRAELAEIESRLNELTR
jgi:hypothetical protein